MTVSWFDDAFQAGTEVPRGGAPVGVLAELPALERGAIAILRLWCDGVEGQAQIARDLSQAFGPARAGAELDRIATCLDVVLSGARRPMMRHASDCACFGGDESAFAHLAAAAVVGDRDDALVFALALVSPQHAFAAVQAAEGFGLAVLALTRPGPVTTRH